MIGIENPCQLHRRITIGSWLDHQQRLVSVRTNKVSTVNRGPALSGSPVRPSTDPQMYEHADGSPDSPIGRPIITSVAESTGTFNFGIMGKIKSLPSTDISLHCHRQSMVDVAPTR